MAAGRTVSAPTVISPDERGLRVWWNELTGPERLRDYLEAFTDSESSRLLFLLRHPVWSVASLRALRRLERLAASPADTVEGRKIRWGLECLSGPLHAVAISVVPDSPAQVGQGAHNQTLRRKVRSANRRGITCVLVDDRAERDRLYAAAAEYEQCHPMAAYRNAEPDNADMFDFGLWMAAYAADGRPLLLTVAPVDGEWAMLRYFRTIGSGEEQSDARYLAHYALVTQLAGMGVRYLFDVTSLASLPKGLRHYQRMVGFHIVKVRVRK
jgi:hypothetical protein